MTKNNQDNSIWHDGFVAGYTAALAALHVYCEDSIYDDLVRSSGMENEIIKSAQRAGNMRWSGLSDYLKRAIANGVVMDGEQ